MDGLECNELTFDEIMFDNQTKRIDSKFYLKEVIKIKNEIKSRQHFFINPKNVVSGPFGSTMKSDAYLEVGDISFVRIENISNGFDIDSKNLVFISNENNNIIKNSQLFVDDIVLSKVGKIGCFARVDNDIRTCNISENNIGIKLFDFDQSQKHYILTYLNCKYAQKLIKARTSGNVQEKLNVSDICYIPIPKFTDRFYKAISTYILNSKDLMQKSKKMYCEADKLLKETIGLDCLNKIMKNITTKSSSASINFYDRFDAEYYHPKYDVLLDILSKQKTIVLGGENGIVLIKKSIEPGSESYVEEGIPFVRVSDIDKFGISDTTIKLSKDIVDNIEDLYPKKDTILLSKDGSVGIAYKLEENIEAVTSSALLHLTVRDLNIILPDYLTLVLNSPIVQLQAERDCNGAIIQHWKPSDIEKVLIPILDMSIQQEIVEKVQESFRLRRESKRLLDVAVKSVEMAIEKDEKTALEWLELQK